MDKARKVRKRAAMLTILNDALHKMGFSMPYLRCVEEEEAKYILEEDHEGVCGDHIGPRSLVNKIIRTGYIIGRPCTRKQKSTWRNVIKARGLGTFNESPERR